MIPDNYRISRYCHYLGSTSLQYIQRDDRYLPNSTLVYFKSPWRALKNVSCCPNHAAVAFNKILRGVNDFQ